MHSLQIANYFARCERVQNAGIKISILSGLLRKLFSWFKGIEYQDGQWQLRYWTAESNGEVMFDFEEFDNREELQSYVMKKISTERPSIQMLLSKDPLYLVK